jgi:hypothetical protein
MARRRPTRECRLGLRAPGEARQTCRRHAIGGHRLSRQRPLLRSICINRTAGRLSPHRTRLARQGTRAPPYQAESLVFGQASRPSRRPTCRLDSSPLLRFRSANNPPAARLRDGRGRPKHAGAFLCQQVGHCVGNEPVVFDHQDAPILQRGALRPLDTPESHCYLPSVASTREHATAVPQTSGRARGATCQRTAPIHPRISTGYSGGAFAYPERRHQSSLPVTRASGTSISQRTPVDDRLSSTRPPSS